MKAVHPRHAAANDRARQAYADYRGPDATAARAAAIEALPRVIWRGRDLRTVWCTGDFGKGPHAVHLPPYVLWTLLDLRHYRCPYHC